jgi:hypothetical protein
MAAAARRPRTVLVLAVIALVAAVAVASRVTIETDILALVPEDNPVVQAFTENIERFGSLDLLVLVVHVDPQRSDASLAYADRLAAALEASEQIDWVEHRLSSPTEAAVPLLDRATLFLEPAEVAALLARLDDDGLSSQARTLRRHLIAPQGLVLEELLRSDPLLLLPNLMERFGVSRFGSQLNTSSGYFLDGDGDLLLILARPKRPVTDIVFGRELLRSIPELERDAAELWRGEGWQGPEPTVEVGGSYMIAREDTRLIVSDVVVGLVGSMLGVMALFLVAFRRPAALLYAVAPLLIGLALTFAFAALVLGRLSSVTSGFAALLIGLGIDFIIVLYGRYVEERRQGVDHAAAIAAVARHTGTSVVLGAVTTAATFYAFLGTEFRGLSELGLITGTGILLVMLSVFLVLAALLSVTGRGRAALSGRLYLHSFGSDALCRFSVAHPWTTVVATAALTVGAGLAAANLELDDDIRNMRSAGNRGVQLQERIMDAFGLRFSPMTVVVDGADEHEAIERARKLAADLKPLADGEVLASIDTIVEMIPPRSEQQAVLDLLKAAEIDRDAFKERLARALRGAGLSPAGFREGIEHAANALTVDRPLHLTDLLDSPLRYLIERYVARTDDGVSTVIYCFPPTGKWRRMAPPDLEAVVADHPHATLSGPNIVSAELRRLVWSDAAEAAALGLLVVLLLLWADLGSLTRGLLALVPLLVGAVWMLGLMSVLGVEMNLFNIFVVTMVIGIGVDYGVHLLHRWSEANAEGATETAKAIAVAALTTMVGFGSLVLSHYPGLRSMGAAAILGAASTAVLSITLLPALLALADRRARRHRGSL